MFRPCFLMQYLYNVLRLAEEERAAKHCALF